MRERFHFLKEILPHYVRFITPDGWSQVSVPLLFWPFSGVAGLPDMRQGGRNKSFWDARVHGVWGQFFGSEDKFLSSASQLEFVLEFNSYIFEGVKIPEVQKLWESFGNIYFACLPDFWTRPLDAVLPMAERFYDILGQSDKFPPAFAIETRAMDSIFKSKGAQERLLFLGCFLAHLISWQAKVMMEQNRFPFYVRVARAAQGDCRYVQAGQGGTASEGLGHPKCSNHKGRSPARYGIGGGTRTR